MALYIIIVVCFKLLGNEFTGELVDFPFKNISLLTLEIIVDDTTTLSTPNVPEQIRTIKFGFKPALGEAKG